MKEKIVVRDLKVTSRSMLTGKWKQGAIINLLLAVIFIGTGILKGLLGLGSMAIDDSGHVVLSIVVDIVTGFVALGIYNGAILGWTASFYRFVNDESELNIKSYSEFLVDRFKKSFCYGFAYSFFIGIWTLGFYIVGIMAMALITKTDSTILTLLLLIIGSIAIIGGIVIGIVKVVEYSMARYIIIDRPDIRAREALKESKRLIYGYKVNYIVLGLHFIGWIILTVVTCGIAGLWVGSYFGTTEAQFYKKLKELKKTSDSSSDMDAFIQGVEIE